MKFLLCFHSSESKIPLLNWLTNAAEVFEAILVQIRTTKEKQSPLRVLNCLKENGNVNIYRWGDTKYFYIGNPCIIKDPFVSPVPVKGDKNLVVILCLLLISSLPFFCFTALTTSWSSTLPVLHTSQKATHASERCSWFSWQCRAANGTKDFKAGKLRMICKINMYYSVMSEVHTSCFVLLRACSLSAVRFSVYDWGMTDSSIHFQA